MRVVSNQQACGSRVCTLILEGTDRRRLLYYAAVCILTGYIVFDIIIWFSWQYAPLTRIDIDL